MTARITIIATPTAAVYGTLQAGSDNLPGCVVSWDERHVAPVVRVGDAQSSQLMISDPSLFERGPVPLASWLARFDSPPIEKRCTDRLVFDQPIASSPNFDDSRLDEYLAAARAAFVSQVAKCGAPPYAQCDVPHRSLHPSTSAGEITKLLAGVRAGDAHAREVLCEKVYAELHRLADFYLGNERPGHLLQPTLLVHDAYMGLIGQDKTLPIRIISSRSRQA